VSPEETLEFKPSGMSGQAGADKSIRDLLAEVRLIKKETEEETWTLKKAENTPENETEKDDAEIWFIDLFDAQRLIFGFIPHHLNLRLMSVTATAGLVNEGRNLIIVALVGTGLHIRIFNVSGRIVIDKPESKLVSGEALTALKNLFNSISNEASLSERKQEIIRDATSIAGVTSYTEAANLALRLPARGVLDLWQLAYWATKEYPTHLQAEKIARTMLRNAIAESSMPNEMSRLLQERIIQRNPQRGTLLNFWISDPTSVSRLYVTRLRVCRYALRPSMKVRKTAAKYTLIVNQTYRMLLSLQGVRPSRAGEVDGEVNQDSVRLKLRALSDDLTSDLVVGWLSVLYDVIQWGVEDSAVIASLPPSPSVTVECWCEDSESVFWPLPDWTNFISHDVYGQLWRRFLRYLEAAKLLNLASREGFLPRLLVTGWIACVVETFLALEPQGMWRGDHGILKQLEDDITCDEHCGTEERIEAIKKATENVMKAAADVYAEILKRGEGGTIYRAGDETFHMVEWFEERLPSLLNHLFVLMADSGAKTQSEIRDFLEDTELAKCWEDMGLTSLNLQNLAKNNQD
jgi:hypothetical protein